MWEAYAWIENVSCHHDYSGEYAEGWDVSTIEHREELEAEVRAVMAKWLDRHGLRPQFFVVQDIQEFIE